MSDPTGYPTVRQRLESAMREAGTTRLTPEIIGEVYERMTRERRESLNRLAMQRAKQVTK